MHILSPETCNWPSWIKGREWMTVENISWQISTKTRCRIGVGWGGRTRNLLITSRTPLRSASTLLHWLILYILAYPEVQRMVQLEIDNLVGEERKVVLNDRSKLHYTPVIILEVMRVNNIAPLAWPHSTTIDIKMNGYETDTLRKHAYSNILKILPPKTESF